jgi:hypothetical protein
MMVRFQADANLNQIILLAVRRREAAVDFQTATEAGLAGLMDPEVLARAAQDGRVLVTHDRKTMPQHFAAFITTATSTGVLIIPQHLSVAAAVDDLLLIWHATEAEEWINQIRSLPL